jgi:AcrR family transcriptional regulator
MNKRLGRNEWIAAGLKELAKHGIDAVRVERLAAQLKVTKGSFYWHFKNRGALLAALLEAWLARATNAIIEQVEAEGGNARTRLKSLFSIVGQVDGRLDRAIRNWAARDVEARATLLAVDQRRFDYLNALFLEMRFSAAEAIARARLVYHALIGQFMMESTASHEERLAECLEIVLPMLVRKD